MKQITVYLLGFLFLQTIVISRLYAQTATNKLESTGNVGIGTTTPAALLDIIGGPLWTTNNWRKSVRLAQGNAIQFSTGGTSYMGIGATQVDGLYFFSTTTEGSAGAAAIYRMAIMANGNIGIGNNTPQAQLDVSGTFRLGLNNSTGGYAYAIGYHRTQNAQVFGMTADGLLLGGDGNGIDMNIRPNGDVGIGTTNPQSKLAVAGTITAQKVKVTATGWPDYVFHDDYQLPTLAEMEAYIKKHKHLEGIPAAQKIASDGMDVAEINKALLRKLEELTLHVIELGKQNQTLQTQVKTLNDKLTKD